MLKTPLVLAAATAALLGTAACVHAGQPEAAAQSPDVAAGQRLAQRICGECHAVTGDGPSPLADAPPFKDLPGRFDLTQFTDAYDAGMFEGHPRMPLVELDPDQLDELAAFLGSLEKPAR